VTGPSNDKPSLATTPSGSSVPTFRIAPNAAWRAVEDHIFAITPDNRQHELSGEVEVVVWHALAAGPTTLESLVGSLSESFEVSSEDVRADLVDFLGSLRAAHLIEEVLPNEAT
jgi:Coenzyme PQQ synthesis protein D (PqqD)